MAKLTRAKQADYVERITHELKKVASRGELVGYTELMNTVGGPGRGYIGGVLSEVCVNEADAGRPLLTVIVVYEGTRNPGPGYWELPIEMPRPDDPKERARLAIAEQQKVWAYWRANSP
jgi:hypothetical protein